MGKSPLFLKYIGDMHKKQYLRSSIDNGIWLDITGKIAIIRK